MNITETPRTKQPVYFTYKDRVFRQLFKDKVRLLELYNALNGTTYTETDDLSVKKRIKIPTPHYIVFYNGLGRKEEEFYQYLSDSFEDHTEDCLELESQK